MTRKNRKDRFLKLYCNLMCKIILQLLTSWTPRIWFRKYTRVEMKFVFSVIMEEDEKETSSLFCSGGDIMDTSEPIALRVMKWGCPHHYSADIPVAHSLHCSQDLILVVHSFCYFFRKTIFQKYFSFFPSGMLLWGSFSRIWRVPVKINSSEKI